MSLLKEVYNSLRSSFGFQLKDDGKERNLAAIDIEREDGASVTEQGGWGAVSSGTDFFDTPTNEVELIKTYRKLAICSDMERVLNEIRNEIFIFDIPDVKAVDIKIAEESTLGAAVTKKIKEEFDNIYNIMEFQSKGLDLFDSWYIDSKLFLQKVVDENNLKDGIKRFIKIDPLKMKKVVEFPKLSEDGTYDLTKIKTKYIFNDKGSNGYGNPQSGNFQRVGEINPDVITYIDSGIYDPITGNVLGYLWKSIVPYNNMRMMEEALMVTRVVRSPERRVFYVGTGNMSKEKSDEYIQEQMRRFRNKLVYDSSTGSIANKKNILNMVEDFWIPRRDDGKTTEVTTLQGSSSPGSIDDAALFRNKFLESTNVPLSRFREDPAAFVFGKTTEINRDEYRFKKFLDRLRNRFVEIFADSLRTQLLLKNIIVAEDWEEISKSIIWVFAEDNNFVQLKETEALSSKIETVLQVDVLIGRYFDRDWVYRKIMLMDQDEIDDMNKKIPVFVPSTQGMEPPVPDQPGEDKPVNTTQSQDEDDPTTGFDAATKIVSLAATSGLDSGNSKPNS